MSEIAVIASEILYPAPGGAVPARLWRPEGGEKVPGIVFIHEAYGLDAEMQRLAGEFAGWGYAVLAPDLYAEGWATCLRQLMRDLRAESGPKVDQLLAARAFLAAQDFVDPEALGVLGFCIGGGFAILLAKAELFRVAVTFYGSTPRNLGRLCPVVGSYGALDRLMTPQVGRLEQALAEQQVDYDIKVYDGVGHGFMNNAPHAGLRFVAGLTPLHAGYDPDAAADAKQRVKAFLARHFPPGAETESPAG